MARTVDDYDSMAKREMIKAKQEKAMMYVYLNVFTSKLILTDSTRCNFVCAAYCILGASKSSAQTMPIYAVNLRR